MEKSRASVNVLGLEGEVRRVTPIRLGLVGCGGHAYRNVLPVLRYIPEAQLVACCDHNLEKAELYARTDGFQAAAYSDIEQMLAQENLDAVMCVVGFDDITGEPLYPEVTQPILRRGIPVWMEKPPAASAADVARMIQAAKMGETFGQVGFKKVYSPAVRHMKALLEMPEFGDVTQYGYTYSVDMPAEVGNLRSPSGRRFLDDFVHVASVICSLVGSPSAVHVVRGPSGAGIVINKHASGAIGTVTLAENSSGLAPIERLEVIGNGASAVLENGAFLEYFPPGDRGPYGTSTNYLMTGDRAAPSFGPSSWTPEFSLGNLHGGSHFIQGYYHQLRAFVDAVRTGTEPEWCGLEQAYAVMNYIDAIAGSFETWRLVAGQPEAKFRHEVDSPASFKCPATGNAMVMKDGWNYVCRDCGRTCSARASAVTTCGQPLLPNS
ncbi:Gfo/Idh/MocA family protein [Catellatospora methionotrophica]|uniref:Gfo/Idh/MocA family protein n=1 Tax=Catellatospora methionotrophica TaxID=121620 RepID=UPI0033FADA74